MSAGITSAVPAPAGGGAFGARALPPVLERLRRYAAGSGEGWPARWAASLIRRLCLAGRADPVDVEAFPGQRARLYPRDNLSEKRVFASAARWDRAERAALADRLSRTPPPFHFVDAGANAGLYTLALRAVGQIRGLAIEPAPEMLARLRFNLRASGAGEVTVAPVALAAETGAVALAPAGANRGEVAVTGGGRGPHVAARPLLDVVREAGFGRIDALKIDIEGQEAEVLGAFLRDAPPSLRPGLVVIEAPRGADTPALALLRRTGYVTRERTRMNAILAAPRGGRPEPDKTGEAHGQA